MLDAIKLFRLDKGKSEIDKPLDIDIDTLKNANGELKPTTAPNGLFSSNVEERIRAMGVSV